METQNLYFIKPNGSQVLGIPMGTTLESKLPLNPEHFISLTELIEKGICYPKKNSITGKGFNVGFVFEFDNFYCETEKEALTQAKKRGYKTLKESYDDDNHYYSEWFCEDGDDIVVIEFENIQYDVEQFGLNLTEIQ